MTTRPIRLFGDPILNTAAAPVERFDAPLSALAADMLETMAEAGGVGLAANQVGVAKRIFVYSCQGMTGALINPVWRPLGKGTQTGVEGCLSIPEQYADVTRPKQVRLQWMGLDGKTHEEEFDGLWATCAQHELDHLNGVLFIDHLSLLKRNMILRKLAKTRRARA